MIDLKTDAIEHSLSDEHLGIKQDLRRPAVKLPNRILKYTWDGIEWTCRELYRTMTDHFGKGNIVSELVFQRRLREQLSLLGGIDPLAAAVRKEVGTDGGVVYEICHLDSQSDSRRILARYVGITARTLHERLTAHIYQAGRRKRANFGEGTLQNAIREEIAKDREPQGSFTISALEHCSTNALLLEREVYWILTLGTLAPGGYNIRLGGSLGGPANSKLVDVQDGAQRLQFRSIAEALRHYVPKGEDPRGFIGRCRARMWQLNWTIEQAVGIAPPPPTWRGSTMCTVNSVQYASLIEAHEATGLAYDVLKGRWRRLPCDQRAGTDIGSTRRSGERAPDILLPNPKNPDSGPQITSTQFAAEMELGWSTVYDRWVRLQKDPIRHAAMSNREVVAFLGAPASDRGTNLQVTLPNGEAVRGSIRDLARKFGPDGEHRSSCSFPKGYDGIRAALGKLTKYSSISNENLLVAIGVQKRQRTLKDKPEIQTQKRKKKRDNYDIHIGDAIFACKSQSDFVKILVDSLIYAENINAHTRETSTTQREYELDMQKKVTRLIDDNSPADIFNYFNAVDALLATKGTTTPVSGGSQIGADKSVPERRTAD